ncbi:hypothetical protein RCL1_008919 [Eukaryota sp. TZLM3-RCL]
MGITGLLPLVKEAIEERPISTYAGKTIAIDGFGLLHRAAYTCSKEVVLGEPAVGYLAYALKYLTILLNAKIQPYVVFDGISLPSKATTDVARRVTREEAKSKALTALNSGTYSSDELNKLFAPAVSISSTMVLNLVHILRLLQIPCIRAPYEADSQIAFLYKIGAVDGVLAEDSDFIIWGVGLILTKFNLTSQTVKEFHSSRLDCTPFSSSSPYFIRDVCILSGCDYLKSAQGIGLKTALKYRLQFKNIKETLLHLFSLQKIDSEYLEGFICAWLVFSHHVVYDPIASRTLPLNDWNESAVENFRHYFGLSGDSQECAISVVVNQLSLSGSILPECCGRLLNPVESRGISEFLIDTESLISYDFDPLSSVDLRLFLQSNNRLVREKLRPTNQKSNLPARQNNSSIKPLSQPSISSFFPPKKSSQEKSCNSELLISSRAQRPFQPLSISPSVVRSLPISEPGNNRVVIGVENDEDLIDESTRVRKHSPYVRTSRLTRRIFD